MAQKEEEFEIDAEMFISLIRKLFEEKQILAKERRLESKSNSGRHDS